MGTRYDFARDSDDFETRTATTAGRLPWGQRGHLRFGVADQRYARPGDQDGDELWATAGLDMRGAATWALDGQIDGTLRHLEGGDGAWTGHLEARLLPGDRIRGTLGYSRLSYFSYTTFPARIAADLAGGSVEARLTPALTAVLRGDWLRYEDGNERRSGKLYLSWLARPRRPRLQGEIGIHRIDHLRDPANGIWTPRDYRAVFAHGRVEVDLALGILATLDLDGGFADDRVDPGRTPYLSFAGGLIRVFGPVRLEVLGGHSDSNVETGRGYRRSFGTVAATIGL
ncbi:MAG: hypothetical protein R3E12_19160 [Candidatus Eisenbacteria bacterium]